MRCWGTDTPQYGWDEWVWKSWEAQSNFQGSLCHLLLLEVFPSIASLWYGISLGSPETECIVFLGFVVRLQVGR